MKAIVYKKYGPPEVAKLMQVEKPIPTDNELLVKVYCSTVNRTDSGFRSAEYFISRFWSGILKPKYQILGCEFAGIVESCGKDVQQFKIGDRVFGFNDKSFGGHAEYLCIDENAAITCMPDHIPFDVAAAATEGSHYALVDIRAAKVTEGQQTLVYGATGAIGSAAVQLLKHFGARVNAVCNSKNLALVKGLGADVVIDYEKEDFTQSHYRYDFIFDAVGKSSFKACKPVLKENGIYISTELGKNGVNILHALTSPILGTKKLLFPIPSISKDDILLIKELLASHKFKPLIDRSYTLDQITDAYKYVESGEKLGNVVLKIKEF